MKQDKLFITSFIGNILVFLLVLAGTIVMMTIGSGALAENSLSVFKYFTFQSNIFMGVVAFIYGYYQLLMLLNKKDKIPHVLLVFNHVGVAAVGLTFLIVILFLAPGYGFDKMYNNANLFFHALVPIFAMINYLFFEKECRIKFLETLFTIIPPLSYGIVYFIVVASQNAYGNLKIDFYGFGAKGPVVGAFNFLVVVSIAYAIGILIFLGNYLIFKKKRQHYNSNTTT